MNDTPNYGIAFGLPFEQYLAHRGMSKSKLATFAALGDQEREATPAMEIGSLVHCAVLEPDKLDQQYFWTEARRGSKAWDAAVEEAGGRKIVKLADRDLAVAMAESVQAHSEAWELIRGSAIESSVFWTDDKTGLPCKARPDILGVELADLKTCNSALRPAFMRDAFEFRYDWQAAWYVDGLAANNTHRDRMIFIAVEKTAKKLAGMTEKRHQIGLFQVSSADTSRARSEMAEFLRIYDYCQRRGDWPGYPREVLEIEKPQWMNRRDEEI